MSKITIVVAALLLVAGGSALAAEDVPPTTLLTASYAQPVFSTGQFLGLFSVGYEPALTRRIALGVSVGGGYATSGSATGETVSITLTPRFYLSGRAPGGPYLAPTLTAGYAWISGAGPAASGFGWAAGGTIGWSWLMGPVDLRLGVGVQYIRLFAAADRLDVSGVTPSAELALGYSF